jgi:hypothetical protein
MAISGFFFRNGTERDATTVFVAVMDFLEITVAAKTIVKIFRKSS